MDVAEWPGEVWPPVLQSGTFPQAQRRKETSVTSGCCLWPPNALMIPTLSQSPFWLMRGARPTAAPPRSPPARGPLPLLKVLSIVRMVEVSHVLELFGVSSSSNVYNVVWMSTHPWFQFPFLLHIKFILARIWLCVALYRQRRHIWSFKLKSRVLSWQ